MCRGEHVIAVSETVSEYVRQNYGFVAEDRLHLIHRGIDGNEYPRGFQPDDSWKSDFFRQFPATRDQPLLTLVGRLTRLKGHADLLHLLARLRDRGIAAHGLIVGGTDPRKPAYADEMQALAAIIECVRPCDIHRPSIGSETDLRDFLDRTLVVIHSGILRSHRRRSPIDRNSCRRLQPRRSRRNPCRTVSIRCR